MPIKYKKIDIHSRRKAAALESSVSDNSSISGSSAILERKYLERRKPKKYLFGPNKSLEKVGRSIVSYSELILLARRSNNKINTIKGEDSSMMEVIKPEEEITITMSS